MTDIDAGPEATIFRADGRPFEINPLGGHFEFQDIGMAEATRGGHTVRIFRARQGGDVPPALHWHDANFQYVFILKGEIEFELSGARRFRLKAGDSIYQPMGCRHCVTWLSDDLELLEIFSPADIQTTRV